MLEPLTPSIDVIKDIMDAYEMYPESKLSRIKYVRSECRTGLAETKQWIDWCDEYPDEARKIYDSYLKKEPHDELTEIMKRYLRAAKKALSEELDIDPLITDIIEAATRFAAAFNAKPTPIG